MTYLEWLAAQRAAGNTTRVAIAEAATEAERSALIAMTDEEWAPLVAAYESARSTAEAEVRTQRNTALAAVAARAGATVAAPAAPIPTAPATTEATVDVTRNGVTETRTYSFGSSERRSTLYADTKENRAMAARVVDVLTGVRAPDLAAGENGGTNLLPKPFIANVMMLAEAQSPMFSRQYFNTVTMTSATADIPLLTTKPKPSKTAWVDGNGAPTAGRTAASFGTRKIQLNTFGDTVAVSNTLIKESPIQVLTILTELFAEGLVSIAEDLVFNGGGAAASQPEGLLTKTSRVTEFELDEAVGAAPEGVQIADFVESEVLKIKSSDRSSAVLFCNTDFLVKVNKLRNSHGNKLIEQPRPGELFQRILGVPVVETDGIESGETTTTFVVGNFKRAYVVGIGQDIEVESSREAGFTTRQTLVNYSIRMDGKVGQEEAYRIGVIPK